ncbi:sec-independent protein translocase protein [Janibacter sp. HTCC2649]|uniref:Sec-independent protein translocase subunit TatA n=1 Tax=Janibacter sp. HTCC2649 TaxID=313589 RepID=UPI000066ECD9|nr:Sec-independent protein translocase subunit TatA [Janibacter sp. HTCC2649]EAP99084.1 sec-independent protein translocase protein [Janibacter sp. HTCC2649]
MRNIGAPEIIVIAVLLIVIFGWKRLPDAARSLGRSARVFKSEVEEMKNDGKDKKPSETVPGETLRRETDGPAPRPASPIDETAPRTDNQSGPTSGTTV